MRTLSFAGLFVASLLLLSGCSSPSLVTSLDDLTANVSRQGFLTLAQQRVLSLSGLTPSGSTGSVYRYRGDRSPFTAIGISARPNEAPGRDGETVSYIAHRTIDCECEIEHLVAIRDKLLDVRIKAADLISARIERLAARSAQAEGSGQDGSSGGSGSAGTGAASLATKDSAVDTAQDAFNSAWKEVAQMIKEPGYVILQTSRREQGSLSSRLGDFFGFNSEKDQETGGFAVLAGLRTSFLMLGDDFGKDGWATPPDEDWSLIGTRFPFIFRANKLFKGPWLIGQWDYEDCTIVTSKLEAKHVLYARDQLTDQETQTRLKASVEQLRNIDATLKEIDEVEIESVLRSVESLGNLGVLGEAVYTTSPIGAEPEEGSTSWQPVYQVLTDYNDLNLFATGQRRFHFTRWF